MHFWLNRLHIRKLIGYVTCESNLHAKYDVHTIKGVYIRIFCQVCICMCLLDDVYANT